MVAPVWITTNGFTRSKRKNFLLNNNNSQFCTPKMKHGRTEVKRTNVYGTSTIKYYRFINTSFFPPSYGSASCSDHCDRNLRVLVKLPIYFCTRVLQYNCYVYLNPFLRIKAFDVYYDQQFCQLTDFGIFTLINCVQYSYDNTFQ